MNDTAEARTNALLNPSHMHNIHEPVKHKDHTNHSSRIQQQDVMRKVAAMLMNA